MFTLAQLKQIMEKYPLEITFKVCGSETFDDCRMGNHLDKSTGLNEYWYGLTRDGKNAFEYPTFEEFSSAEVFDGKTLAEIWDDVTLLEINGCDPTEMIEIYLS